MRIFIEPAESLMFRTGRPFAAGENTFAESLFPPTPETLQGAVRAAIATHWGQAQQPPINSPISIFAERALNDLIGKRTNQGDTYGRFRIVGLALGRSVPETAKIERLFPTPSHLIQVLLKDKLGKEFQQFHLLKPTKVDAGATNMPAGYDDLLLPDLPTDYETDSKSETGGWLTTRGLGAVLRGDRPDATDYLKPETIFTFEPRLGIGMNNATKTTKEGYLYQIQMVRMQPNYGFVIDIALGEKDYGNSEMPPTQEQRTDASIELAFLKTGWLTLGGEQRAAHFTVLDPQDCAEEHSIAQSSEGNLLYFATPTYFKNGWLPEKATLFEVRPLTAAINRYQSIGGWYLNTQNAGGGSKTMHRCIRAGSIYFFDQDIQVTHPLTEYGWQIGYGIAYTGRWK